MRNAVIYLAGQIAMKKETYLWRESWERWCVAYPEISIINPCNTEFDKIPRGKGMRDQDGYNTEQMKDDAIIWLPYNDYGHVVKRADVIVFDLNHYDTGRMMVGTLFELAWAFTRSDLLTVGVFHGDPEQDKLCRHPFVKAAIQVWRQEHREAFETVVRYL